jgi:hypothetical protein
MKGLIAFGQDLFGNQFCFTSDTHSIVFFNSETGERETIAIDFEFFLRELYAQFNYYTGIPILKEWLANNQLAFNSRLCPKIPFIMGGEFKIDNLYAGTYPAYMRAYSNIAKQIYNLPDGTKVKLQINPVKGQANE